MRRPIQPNCRPSASSRGRFSFLEVAKYPHDSDDPSDWTWRGGFRDTTKKPKWGRVPRRSSFPSSRLGTSVFEAPLRDSSGDQATRGCFAFRLIRIHWPSARSGSRASKKCVPKLELGNEVTSLESYEPKPIGYFRRSDGTSTSRIPWQNAGRSSGRRLLTKWPSIVTGESSNNPPALIKSSLMPGDPVTRTPR